MPTEKGKKSFNVYSKDGKINTLECRQLTSTFACLEVSTEIAFYPYWARSQGRNCLSMPPKSTIAVISRDGRTVSHIHSTCLTKHGRKARVQDTDDESDVCSKSKASGGMEDGATSGGKQISTPCLPLEAMSRNLVLSCITI